MASLRTGFRHVRSAPHKGVVPQRWQYQNASPETRARLSRHRRILLLRDFCDRATAISCDDIASDGEGENYERRGRVHHHWSERETVRADESGDAQEPH